jgi:hypothetical protein
MSHLRLEHLKINELPPQWAKQLPAAQTFTVIIIAENKPSMPEQVTIEPPSDGIGQDDNTPEEREAYLQYLRSQGINLERLRESIDEYKAGKAEILDWDEFEYTVDKTQSKTAPNTTSVNTYT